mmetsp:Transcript_1441/g.3252  ORF Transcript_1441/g.3252 Transcript_1441/m.3252 type:complete len:105 (+) Transcript_1441:1285-1599(+)
MEPPGKATMAASGSNRIMSKAVLPTRSLSRLDTALPCIASINKRPEWTLFSDKFDRPFLYRDASVFVASILAFNHALGPARNEGGRVSDRGANVSGASGGGSGR